MKNTIINSIIIAAYNEEKNIETYKEELIPELQGLGESWELILVDDGSTDKTLENMTRLKNTFTEHTEQIEILVHKKNHGLGSSLRDGIKAAKGEVIIPLDADLTFHPKYIKKLISKYKESSADVIIGSHFSKEGETKNIPLYRLFLSRVVNYLYRHILGQKIASMSSIFRLYQAKDIKELQLTATGFDINAEILFQLIKKKKKIVEVPVVLSTRRYGISKINIKKEAWNHIRILTKILKWRLMF
jgi:dolichol-phosphate mannosyltransferase